MINFNEYMGILEAERVTIHDLIGYFNKEQMDYDEHGNVFVGFNKGNKGSPILVSHMDNVLHGQRVPVLSLDGRYIMGKTAGIGWDDKAGIIANIELFKRMKGKVRIIFTTDEEVGGVSAGKLDPSRYADAKYMIELDRRDKNDLIQYSGSTRLCSDKFALLIEAEGFKRATGTFTDVNRFKAKMPHIEMCNLSIGYFNAHSDNEYLDIKYFNEIVDKVENILNTFNDTYVDDQVDKPTTYDKWDRYDSKDVFDDVEYCDNCGGVIPRGAHWETLTGFKCCCRECRDELEQYLEETEVTVEDKDVDA
jgi:acetylornithine deacetylase/succinyl-diaminopimelate desuccinylase-like protein